MNNGSDELCVICSDEITELPTHISHKLECFSIFRAIVLVSAARNFTVVFFSINIELMFVRWPETCLQMNDDVNLCLLNV